MTQQEFIEKIAAGLRKVDIKPDYLLLNDPPYSFDEICGIPTITTSIGVTSGYDGNSFPVYPAWKKDDEYFMQVYYFQKAYTDYSQS